jgi:enamine deaminase RidA (YjgF/YER057c/UK114 family)
MDPEQVLPYGEIGLVFKSDLYNRAMTVAQKLQSLNITLPKLAGPFGAYIPAKRSGNLIFVAGQLPMKDGKLLAVGTVPSVCSMDDARLAARQCVINALAAVASLGGESLNNLSGVLRVGAFVQSDDDFKQQPQVANAASEFLQELFGSAGQHVRAAIGVNTLPMDAAVEIEFVFEIG